MGEDYKNIDDLFKTELGQTVHKAPAQAKVNIDKALGLRNKRYLYLWLLLPLVAVVFFLYNSGSKENTTGLQKQLVQIDESLNHLEDTRATNASSETHGDAQEIGKTENIEFQLSTNSNDYSNDSKKILADNKSVKVNESQQNKTSKDPTNKNQTSSKNHPKTASTTVLNTTKQDSSQLSSKSSLPNPNQQIKVDLDTSNIASNPNISAFEVNSIDTNSTANNIPPKSDSAKNHQNLPITDSTLTTEIDSTQQSSPEVTINPPEEDGAPWLLTFNSGIDSKWSQMPTFTSNDSTSYDHIINDKIGHQGSIDISYRLKNSLTFGTGIGYSTLLENYTYYQSQMTYDTTYSWNVYLDSIPDSTGWIYFQDSTLEQSVSSNEVELYNANGRNKRTYLHIPIQIGTSLLFDKIRWDVYAQGRFNLLLKSSITYVENDQIVVVPKGGFKQSYFDLVIGTGIHYNLIGNLYLSGSVKYRPPISKEYYPSVTNRFQNVQVGIGFSLGF